MESYRFDKTKMAASLTLAFRRGSSQLAVASRQLSVGAALVKGQSSEDPVKMMFLDKLKVQFKMITSNVCRIGELFVAKEVSHIGRLGVACQCHQADWFSGLV